MLTRAIAARGIFGPNCCSLRRPRLLALLSNCLSLGLFRGESRSLAWICGGCSNLPSEGQPVLRVRTSASLRTLRHLEGGGIARMPAFYVVLQSGSWFMKSKTAQIPLQTSHRTRTHINKHKQLLIAENHVKCFLVRKIINMRCASNFVPQTTTLTIGFSDMHPISLTNSNYSWLCSRSVSWLLCSSLRLSYGGTTAAAASMTTMGHEQ